MKGPAEVMLRALAGDNAEFRDGQWDAISALLQRRRVLVVQRTGWGKSAVYLLATRLRRNAGAGPTVIVSPLLVLMRNQIEMAERAGVTAATINSANREDWEETEAAVSRGEIDLLLVSPERLANDRFQEEVMPGLVASMGMLVVDEAHCISDWGHDFRPDYRRLARLVAELPPDLPVLATTATANDRVVADVTSQLGEDLEVIRGPLDRPSLGLQVVELPDSADRLAWLAQTIPTLSGSGIVYSLTVRDAERVGEFLRSEGFDAATYTGPMTGDERLEVEGALRAGEIRVVSATSALGMGYDNPFVEFVIHFQSPGSPVAYYQQVGRAGRAVERSVGVLLSGAEDTEIQDWFIETAFPPEPQTRAILEALADPRTVPDLERVVNLSRGRIGATLKQLEVEGAVAKKGNKWVVAEPAWRYPHERLEAVTAVRRSEQALMRSFLKGSQCLMAVLRRALDDEMAAPCGRCAVCCGRPLLPVEIEPTVRARALRFLRRSWIEIPPRVSASADLGIRSLKKHRSESGRALCSWGDPDLGSMVQSGKFREARFDDRLVEAAADLVRQWQPDPPITWIGWVPNNGEADVVGDLAHRLALALGLRAVPAVRRLVDRPRQSTMENSFRQASNQVGAYSVERCPTSPMMLVDDTVDSRWTFAVVGAQLRAAGVEAVYPFALADTSRVPG